MDCRVGVRVSDAESGVRLEFFQRRIIFNRKMGLDFSDDPGSGMCLEKAG